MGVFNFLSRKKSSDGGPPKSRGRKTTPGGPDPLLSEKKRARRRLIGALAIVLIVIVGLPLVLDTKPKPVASDIPILVPQANNAQTSANIATHEQKLNNEAITQLENTPTPEVPLSEPPPVPAQTTAAAPAKPQSTPTPAPARAADSKPRTAPTPEEKPAAPKSAQLAPDAERAMALLEGKLPTGQPASKNTENTRLALQVAAVAEVDKAEQLKRQLAGNGIHAWIERVATSNGERYRVRIGPFYTQGEVDQMRNRLSAMGLTGTVVKP